MRRCWTTASAASRRPSTAAYGRDVAEEVHRELRRLGGVKPPREFVFMDRAAIGLGSVFMHLKAEINWHRLFHELIDDFDAERPGRAPEQGARRGEGAGRGGEEARAQGLAKFALSKKSAVIARSGSDEAISCQQAVTACPRLLRCARNDTAYRL